MTEKMRVEMRKFGWGRGEGTSMMEKGENEGVGEGREIGKARK